MQVTNNKSWLYSPRACARWQLTPANLVGYIDAGRVWILSGELVTTGDMLKIMMQETDEQAESKQSPPLLTESSEAPASPGSSKLVRSRLPWISVCVAAIALAAVAGVLAWKVADLSERVNQLSASSTTLSAPHPYGPTTSTVTTTSTAWSKVGGALAYQKYMKAFEGVAYNRNYYTDDWNKRLEENGQRISESMAATQATRIQDLVNQIRKLPPCPEEIRDLQNAYVDVLVDKLYALEARARGDSGSTDELNSVLPREYKAFLAWTDAIGW